MTTELHATPPSPKGKSWQDQLKAIMSKPEDALKLLVLAFAGFIVLKLVLTNFLN